MSAPFPANDLTLDVDLPSLKAVESEHIRRVLMACRGNVSRTARVLGIDRRTLQRKLKDAMAPDALNVGPRPVPVAPTAQMR